MTPRYPHYTVVRVETNGVAHVPMWRVNDAKHPDVYAGSYVNYPEDAAYRWVQDNWSEVGSPEEMVVIVTHSDGRAWKIRVEAALLPSFSVNAEPIVRV